MLSLEEKLKNLPDKPGVYLMRNEQGQIIYVGKAINLKNRVRQYFQSGKNQLAKVNAMVDNINDFEYIITKNELEALILECNLIKRHRPRYNVMLKDDKNYPYIKITFNESYPRVIIVREIKKDKGKYFGPYTDSKAVKQTIDLVQRIFPLRSCSKDIEKIAGKIRPCLNAHINRCVAPCTGKVSKEDYDKIIKDICLFLEGKQQKLIYDLEKKMDLYAENLEFEKAAEVRDQLEAVKKVKEEQIIISSKLEDFDVIAYDAKENLISVQVFFIRLGKLLGRESFFLTDVGTSEGSEAIGSFIKQFYNKAIFVPKNVYVPMELEEKEVLEKWLGDKKGSKVKIVMPHRGDKRKLLQMAQNNAEEALRLEMEKADKDKSKKEDLFGKIGEYLGITDTISRIEAFDISNIQGVDNVGSMIVFEEGKPVRKHYRRFRIKSIEGQDDYGSLKEVIERRFLHGIEERRKIDEESGEYENGKFSSFPDLIMMDGGLGQLNAAKAIIDKLALDIPICGMVKDSKHRTRGLIYNSEEIPIPLNTEVFKLITRIQDEAHRFAITYHRSLREKKITKSILDEIPGIGPKRKNSLLKHFKNIEEIRKASLEDLISVKGINKKAAENIINFFINKTF